MKNLNKIKSFLSEAKDITLGYSEINFVDSDSLNNAQVGYSVDPNGNNLASKYEGDWQEEWIVIATDSLGDPIIVNTNSPTLEVLTSAHGEGDWEPHVIAGSLDDFKEIIGLLDKLSFSRANLLDDSKKQALLLEIEKKDQDVAIWFWETFLDNQ